MTTKKRLFSFLRCLLIMGVEVIADALVLAFFDFGVYVLRDDYRRVADLMLQILCIDTGTVAKGRVAVTELMSRCGDSRCLAVSVDVALQNAARRQACGEKTYSSGGLSFGRISIIASMRSTILSPASVFGGFIKGFVPSHEQD